MKLRMKSRDREDESDGIMKLPKRFQNRSDDDNDDDEKIINKIRKSGWLIQGTERKQKAMNESRVLNNRNRPPELWFRDGDEKVLRFRDGGENTPGIWRYQVEVDNQWQTFTVPEEGEVDLFNEELGLRPSLRFIYEVIDLTGYKDKSGKRIKNIARFWVVPERIHTQLERLRKKAGPLNNFDMSVTRNGSKASTTYEMYPDSSSPMPKEFRKIPRLIDEIEKYYAPLPEDEQRLVVKRARVRSNISED